MKHSVHVCVPTLQQPGVENRANTEKFGLDAQKYRQLPPPNPAFLKWPFLTDFKKYTHTPPYGLKFWCSGRKMEKTLKIHEFAPRWHILNVPERYCNQVKPSLNLLNLKQK